MARRGRFGGLRHFFSQCLVNRSKRGATCSYEKLMSESNTPSSRGASGRRQSPTPPSICGRKQVPERISVKGPAGRTMSGAPPASIRPRDQATCITNKPPPMKRSKSRPTVTLRKVRDSISRFKEATRNSDIQLGDLYGGNRMLMQVTATPVTRTSKSTAKIHSPSPGVCRRPHLPVPAVTWSSGSFRQR